MTRGNYEPTCPGDDACLWGNCEIHEGRQRPLDFSRVSDGHPYLGDD